MPAVRAGDVLKVEAILNSFQGEEDSTQPSLQSSPQPRQSESESFMPVQDSQEERKTSLERHSLVTKVDVRKSGDDDEDLEIPASKRSRLSTDVAPSTEKSAKLSPEQILDEKECEPRRSERLKSLSEIPPGLSFFETEIPVLEKSMGAESKSSQREDKKERVCLQVEEEDARGYSSAVEKTRSLGILFETSVHNSNVFHVCCQLSDSGAADGRMASDKTGE